MKISLAIIVFMLAIKTACAASPVATPQKMRPYSGIGILMVSITGKDKMMEPYQIYEEPAIERKGELNTGKIPPYEWIFGAIENSLPLIVTSRKGNWLRVAYDDAGREAWLDPRRTATFQTWDSYLKGQAIRLLPGLQKRYYQFFAQPGKGVAVNLLSRHLFTVVKLENDWALAISEDNSIGWLRWRDEDGRLTICLGKVKP